MTKVGNLLSFQKAEAGQAKIKAVAEECFTALEPLIAAQS